MNPDVIVIGAGVTGAAIAYHLSLAGRRVTVVEAAAPAAGASGRSFGWINASFYLNPHHHRMRVAAMAEHRLLASVLPDTGTAWGGTLSWDFGGGTIDAAAKELAEFGYPVQRLSAAEIAAHEPGLVPPGPEALLFPTEGVADLPRLTRALLSAAATRGARLVSGCGVTSILTQGGRVAGVMTPLGPISAPQVVVAAGTGAPELLTPLGAALPMLHRPAVILRTRPVPPLLRHIIVTPTLEFRQESDGRILAPAAANHQSDDASVVEGPVAAIAASVLARLRAALPAVALDWDEAVLATRPVPGDGMPVIGPVGPEGLYLAVLHSGATLSPLVGKVAAAELTGGGEDPLLAPCRPARFG